MRLSTLRHGQKGYWELIFYHQFLLKLDKGYEPKKLCYLVSNRKVVLIDFTVNTTKRRCPACLFIKDLILTVYVKLLIMKVVCIFYYWKSLHQHNNNNLHQTKSFIGEENETWHVLKQFFLGIHREECISSLFFKFLL